MLHAAVLPELLAMIGGHDECRRRGATPLIEPVEEATEVLVGDRDLPAIELAQPDELFRTLDLEPSAGALAKPFDGGCSIPVLEPCMAAVGRVRVEQVDPEQARTLRLLG